MCDAILLLLAMGAVFAGHRALFGRMFPDSAKWGRR